MQQGFITVKAQRLSDSAVEQFVRLVKNGKLTPGTQIPPEREMVRLLSVSRSSYREAVRVLETMGILEVIPGRGTWVCQDVERRIMRLGNPWLAEHERDVMELLELRRILEVQAAALAASRASDEDLARLEGAVAVIREAASDGTADSLVAADTFFHVALVEAAKNRVLTSSVVDLYRHLEPTRRAMLAIPGRRERMEAEHRAILEAVCTGEPDTAQFMVLQHVRLVEREVEAAIAAGRLAVQRTERRGDTTEPRNGNKVRVRSEEEVRQV